MPANPNTSLLSTLAQLDTRACAHADARVEAVYRKGGAGAGKPVSITVAPIMRRDTATQPSKAQVAAGGTQTHASYRLEVIAWSVGETLTDPAGGVGDLGGVVVMSPADTFEVHGSVVGKPDAASVLIRVGNKCDLIEHAYWSAEVIG